jgi:predicted nucleic acid-binding protein
MVVKDFYQKTIFLDTAPLIYFIEGGSIFQEILVQLFEANKNGDFNFITSSITLLEVLVKPIKEGRLDLAEHYKYILNNAKGITIFDITNNIAVKAAEIRAKIGLKTPDSIQVATAIENYADYFLTNDLRLKSVADILTVTLSEISE